MRADSYFTNQLCYKDIDISLDFGMVANLFQYTIKSKREPQSIIAS